MSDEDNQTAAFPEPAPEFPEPKEDPEPSLEEPAPVETEPEPQPDTIEVLNEASREPETITFAAGPGDTIRIHHGDWVAILSKDNFLKVVDWFASQ